MLDLEPIFEFSRQNCVAICAFLIPANLTVTLITILLSIREKSGSKIFFSAAIATFFALTLFLHVSTCLLTNLGAIAYRQQRIDRLIKDWQ